MKTDKESKTFILKSQNFIQSSKILKVKDKRKKISMNLLWQKEIFWEHNLLEETINQHFYMKK